MARSGRGRRLGQLLQLRLVKQLNNYGPIRVGFRALRQFAPVLVLGKTAVVSRHDDCVEVFRRDEDFTISELNAPVMDRVNGPFILGMDRGEQYDRENGILERCVHPGDLDRIRQLVRTTVTGLVDAARPHGRVEVVNGLARVSAARVVSEYFGIAGPDEATLMRWMRSIFYETFMNVTRDPGVQKAGEASGAEFHAYVHRLIAERRAQIAGDGGAPDDFFTRLVRLASEPETQLSDEGIIRNIGGVVVGALDTTSKATTHAVYELLRRPDVLVEARQADRSGGGEALTPFVLEALRFNPLNPALARKAARDTVIAAGTRREHKVPAGCLVYLAIGGAMFDAEAFPEPDRFRTDRPQSAYLHFGHAMHTCFGEHVNVVQMPEIVSALVKLDNLRLAPGQEGRIVYDGPFPDRLLVDFDPSRN
jgi:cytochrome P450